VRYYVESDFLLALIKGDDWLSSRAGEIYQEYGASLVTSSHALLEVLMVLDLKDIDDFPELVGDMLEIADLLHVEEKTVFQAAFFMEEGATPFDAFHAALAGNKTIISSDKKYDELGIERVKLEE
jgi:predicted nucleic acid-binding protein